MSFFTPSKYASSANPRLVEMKPGSIMDRKLAYVPSHTDLSPSQKALFLKQCLEELEATPGVAPEIISSVKQMFDEAKNALTIDGHFILTTKEILAEPTTT